METESITSPDVEEAAMRELGVETDAAAGRGQVDEPQDTMSPERSVDPDTAPQPDAPAPPESPEPQEVPEPQRDHPQQVPRDPRTGKFQQRDGKPDTEYSKAVKEQARIARTWQQIQAEKEQIRTEKAQWDEHVRMQQLEQARQQYQPLKKDGLTAQEYYNGAKVFEREGDYENAYKAHQVAQEMFQAEQNRAQQMRGVDAEYQWRSQMAEVGKVAPQIWDSNSPIHQHLARIIETNPWLYNVPQGFYRAAEYAHMLVENQQLKEAQDEIIALKAENEKYRRKSQPARGGYAAPRTQDKEFDEMDLPDMEAHLKAMTAEADNYR